MYKIVKYIGRDSVDLDGHYNKCPRGWKHLSEEEFAKSHLLGVPKYIEFRQVRIKKDYSPAENFNSKLLSTYLYWHDRFYGYALAVDSWKGKVHYFSFQASKEEMLSDIKRELPNIESDSGWALNKGTSITYRGIRDYDRTIKFEKPLSEDEKFLVFDWLKNDDCPGYTGIVIRTLNDSGLYRFSTTYDSSD